MSSVVLTDLIAPDILQELSDAFSEYSGMASVVTDANGTPVTKGSGFSHFCTELVRKSEKGRKNCEHCDRQGAVSSMQSEKPVVYPCHAGLTDYAAPILLNGEFIGGFIGGQVRTEELDLDFMRKKAGEYGIDPGEYAEAAGETRLIPGMEIEKAATFLSRLCEVLSKLALQHHLAMEEGQSAAETERSRSDFLRRLAEELGRNIREMDLLFSESDNRKLNSLLVRTMELGNTIEDAADYSEIMNSDHKLHESVYNVRSLIRMKVREFIKQAEAKNNKLEYEVAPDVPEELMGDPERIGRVIGKLIENSNRFTENSWIRVSAGIKNLSYSTILELCVADGGSGITEEKLKDINSYITSGGYASIKNEEFDLHGFSLIGYHVNLMSGKVDIDSEVGKGSRFMVSIPQLKA